MAVTYATGVTPANTQTPYNAKGQTQNARRRCYQSKATLAAQAIADEIVIARPHPGEVFSGFRFQSSVTLSTSTLQLRQYDKNGTLVTTFSAAIVDTTPNTWIEPAQSAATNVGTVLDGGELRVVVAALALPAAGTLTFEVDTIGY